LEKVKETAPENFHLHGHAWTQEVSTLTGLRALTLYLTGRELEKERRPDRQLLYGSARGVGEKRHSRALSL